MAARAVVFIDGNNWYHSIRRAGVMRLNELDYALISRKLVQHRAWLETRYYIGHAEALGLSRSIAGQRRFLARPSRSRRPWCGSG